MNTAQRIGLAFVAIGEVFGIAAEWLGEGLPQALQAACFFMAINGFIAVVAGAISEENRP